MRQRRVTGIEDRLAVYSDLLLKPQDSSPICDWDDSNLRGTIGFPPRDRHVRWYQRLSEIYALPEGFDRTYAESGCGRGLFINTLAKRDPDGLYIGIEGCKTIVYSAVKKTHNAGLKNLFYIDSFINDAATAFEEEELAGIFLNFSDPWPKDRHADRRLTAPAKVKSYYRILKSGGFIALKTDKEAFFDYSLETFKEAGFHIEYYTRDLEAPAGEKSPAVEEQPASEKQSLAEKHPAAEGQPVTEEELADEKQPIAEENIRNAIITLGKAAETEYELRFRALGQPIYYLLAGKSNTEPLLGKLRL